MRIFVSVDCVHRLLPIIASAERNLDSFVGKPCVPFFTTSPSAYVARVMAIVTVGTNRHQPEIFAAIVFWVLIDVVDYLRPFNSSTHHSLHDNSMYESPNPPVWVIGGCGLVTAEFLSFTPPEAPQILVFWRKGKDRYLALESRFLSALLKPLQLICDAHLHVGIKVSSCGFCSVKALTSSARHGSFSVSNKSFVGTGVKTSPMCGTTISVSQ